MKTPSRPLPRGFFDRPADRVARELLGSRLAVRDAHGRVTRHVVVATEAYLGSHDLACHVGPGRLTKALGIAADHNGKRAARASGLWFEEGLAVPDRIITRTPRIGVGYAGEWAAKPLRFVVNPEKLPMIKGVGIPVRCRSRRTDS